MGLPDKISSFTPGSDDTPLDTDRMNEFVAVANAFLMLQGTNGIRVTHADAGVLIELEDSEEP